MVRWNQGNPPREEFRFGACVLRADARELWRDGRLQKIERRSFDLILYLVRQAGRVVTKDELLERVWGKRHVSDSVIAQSMMKARKALGCKSGQSPIRTLHRVGYRFVGEVEQILRPGSEAATLDRSAPCVEWRPIEWCAGEAAPRWMEHTLQALVEHVFALLGVTLAEAGTATPDADPPNAVVRARMLRADDGYALHWVLRDRDRDRNAEQVQSADSPVLCVLRAVTEVASLAWLRHLDATHGGQPDLFWRELSRLLYALDTWRLVQHPWDMRALVGESRACSIGSHEMLLLVCAQRGEDSVPELAAALRERAQGATAALSALWADLCTRLHRLHNGQVALGALQLARAVDALALQPDQPRLVRTLLLASHLCSSTGDSARASECHGRAARIAATRTSKPQRAWIDLQSAELSLLRDDITHSAEACFRAMDSARQGQLPGLLSWSQSLTAVHHLATGDPSAAQPLFEEARWNAEQGGCASALTFAILQSGLLAARAGDALGLSQACQKMRGAGTGSALRGAAGRWLQARQARLEGDVPRCAVLLQGVIDRVADLGLWWMEDAWLFVADTWLALGDRHRALALLERMRLRRQARNTLLRQSSCLAVQGALAAFDGQKHRASALLKEARRLGDRTALAGPLGMAWATLAHSKGETRANLNAALAPAGQWLEFARVGRTLVQRLDRSAAAVCVLQAQPISARVVSEPAPDPLLLWAV